jgi:hypothetical protein
LGIFRYRVFWEAQINTMGSCYILFWSVIR